MFLTLLRCEIGKGPQHYIKAVSGKTIRTSRIVKTRGRNMAC